MRTGATRRPSSCVSTPSPPGTSTSRGNYGYYAHDTRPRVERWGIQIVSQPTRDSLISRAGGYNTTDAGSNRQTVATGTITTVDLRFVDEHFIGQWNLTNDTLDVRDPGAYEIAAQVAYAASGSTITAGDKFEAYVEVNGSIEAIGTHFAEGSNDIRVPVSHARTLSRGDTVSISTRQNTWSDAEVNPDHRQTFLVLSKS